MAGALATLALAVSATAFSGGQARADEISYDWAINFVKAPAAWARTYTGAGVTVAVMDTGVANIKELSGRLMSMWNAYKNAFVSPADDNGHGSFVAGLVGAARNNVGTVGVAYDARILPVKVLDRSGTLRLSDATLAKAYDQARIYGAKVSNNSWNSSTTAPELVASYGYAGAVNIINSNFGQTLAAMQRFVNNGGVLVFAAGNDGKTNPGYWASLPYFNSALQPGFLTAVAIDKTGVIASWSDRCGISAAYCLAAPGVDVVSTTNKGGYKTWSGTSFSAPIVAGAVAVIMDMWPYLGAGDVTSILLTSANKTGIYANSAIYGQGLLDLDAATKPVGGLTIAGTGTSSTTSLSQTQLGSTFGMGGKATNLVVLDKFKRDFYISADALVVRAPDSFNLGAALYRFGAGEIYRDQFDYAGGTLRVTSFVGSTGVPWQQDNRRTTNIASSDGWTANFGFRVDAATATALSPLGQQFARLAIADRSVNQSHAGVIQDAAGGAVSVPWGNASFTFGFASGQSGKDGVQNIPLATTGLSTDEHNQTLWTVGASFEPWSNVKLMGSVGRLSERNSILGNRQTGSLSFGTSALTNFVSLGSEVGVGGGIFLFGGYDLGWTKAGGATGALVSDVSTVTSSAWRLGVKGENVIDRGDLFLLALSQPLAVTKGRLTTTMPTSYDGFTGDVGYTRTTNSLAAARRETDLQAAYGTQFAGGIGLTVGGLLRINPNNDNAPAQAIGFARVDWRY